MIPVKTRQKYKCDFCKRRSTKSVMEKHEKRCFRNPNRFCDFCDNRGYFEEDINGDGSLVHKEDCPYCSKRDPKIEADIKKYEESIEKLQTLSKEETKVPF